MYNKVSSMYCEQCGCELYNGSVCGMCESLLRRYKSAVIDKYCAGYQTWEDMKKLLGIIKGLNELLREGEECKEEEEEDEVISEWARISMPAVTKPVVKKEPVPKKTVKKPVTKVAAVPKLVKKPIESKVVVMGGAGSGKTTWVKMLLTGEFDKKYIPTQGVSVHNNIKGLTTLHSGGVERVYNIWDTAGQENLGGLRDGYYIGGDVYKGEIYGVIFIDGSVSRKLSLPEARKYYKDFKRVNPGAPVVFVMSKMDVWGKKSDINSVVNRNSVKQGWIDADPSEEVQEPLVGLNCKEGVVGSGIYGVLQALHGE